MNISQFFATHRLIFGGVAVIVGFALGVITSQVLRKHRKPKRPKSETASDSVPVPASCSSATPAAISQTASEPSIEATLNPQSAATSEMAVSSIITPWPKASVSGNGISSNWAEFVRDRLGELDPASCDNETKWALGVVDFLDELKEADAEASSEERASSASLRAALLACLSDKGFALEDSDEWNPDKQRAVAVVRKPDATVTTILGKGSTGLSRNGKIIRKQEVKIVTKVN